MNFLTGLSEVVETLQELRRMHQLNMELLEQFSIACDFLLKSGVTIPNASTFASLLNKSMVLLNEIQADTPKILQYKMLSDESYHDKKSDEKLPEPAFGSIISCHRRIIGGRRHRGAFEGRGRPLAIRKLVICFKMTAIVLSFLVGSRLLQNAEGGELGQERMFLDPASFIGDYLLVGETFTVYVKVANMSQVGIVDCHLKWDPQYLELVEVTRGNCIQGGGLVIGSWDRTTGIVWLCYGVLCCGNDVLLGTAMVCTFRVVRVGASVIDLYGMSCWDEDLHEILKGDSPYDCTISMIQWPSPVGGYSLSLVEPALASQTTTYLAFIVMFSVGLSLLKRRKRLE